MIDISDLLNKRDNAEQQQYIEEQGIPAEETLPAEEFVNKIVKPIRELQDADAHNVKKIMRGSYEYTPVNGVITLPGEGVSVQIFTTASRDQNHPDCHYLRGEWYGHSRTCRCDSRA